MSDVRAAGWKTDPQQVGLERWWDGTAWTHDTRAAGGALANAPVPSAVGVSGSSAPTFYFDGGAATYFGTSILAFLVTVLTLGIAFPFALVLRERWKAKHTFIEGRQLIFNGSGLGLFGHWIKWFLLTIITLGIYSFWVMPRLTKWKVENTDFNPQPDVRL